MASSKPNLARDGTMKMTADDGKSFLDRNLTDWKKPYLMDQFESGSEEEEEEEEEVQSKKPKLSKHTTMKATAKEAATMLGSTGPDEDVLTRGQQKQLDNIKNEKPKPKVKRDNTMVKTAKAGKTFVGSTNLKDTRLETKKTKASPKKSSAAAAETSSRSLRKRPASSSPGLKRAGTMQNTAKEGKAFLKRGKKGGKKGGK